MMPSIVLSIYFLNIFGIVITSVCIVLISFYVINKRSDYFEQLLRKEININSTSL